MKRMYVTLILMFLVLIAAAAALGQKISTLDEDQNQGQIQKQKPFDRMKRRMELREEMHKRMRDKLLHGIGPDHDLFKDIEQMFEDSMSDSFSSFDNIGSDFSNFKSEWIESKTGRTLVITPQGPDQKLNIDVNESVITIKGESEKKTSTSSFSSAFTNSFPVPDDCDGTKVKMDQKDGKILVELPFKEVKKISRPPKEEERKSLPHSKDDITI